ncbi:MAG: nidogen-like domain-containing protein, partial [Thermodesulfobacteriota bacterium]|nr:nidogen-like domain-containing protein [Thermodesulfobacteriota bacterium]
DGNDVLYGGAPAVGAANSGFDHIFGGTGDDSIRGGDEAGGDNTGGMFGADVDGDGTLVTGLGGSANVGENVFDRNDNMSTFVDLTPVFSNGLNFFGQTYTGLHINNNGNLSFGSAFPDYQPYPLSQTATPVIAGFWGDVDTRAVPGSADENLVYYDLNTTDNVFTVTWYMVGYYNQHLDHVNAFQIQLFDQGGGDFNVVFRYDDITWAGNEQNAARAGFSDGDGTFWELDGSGLENDMLDIDDRGGNTGKEGLWYFEFQSGNLVAGAPPNCDELGGGPGNDTIHGEGGNDLIGGHEGDDSLSGGGDNDIISGDIGGDTIDGGTGDDTLYGGDDSDSLRGGAGQDDIRGGAGGDTLYGDADDDELFGDSENDTLDGGGGSDTMYGGFGDDSLTDSGADPDDWVSYNESDRSLGLTIDLSNNSATDGSETDEIHSIENVMASDFNDSLVGDTANNYLVAFCGADTLEGGTGADTLDAGGDSDSDIFYYDNCTTEGNAAEKIYNFHSSDDEVHISKGGSGLGAGFTASNYLNGTNFETTASSGGAGASLGTEQFLYSTGDHILYYDADGVSGGGVAVAEFDPGMSDAPDAGDILIVA